MYVWSFSNIRGPMCSWEILHFVQFSKKWHWPASTTSDKKVSDINEKLDFWWSIPQKRTGIGHLGAKDNYTIRISRFFYEMRLSRSLRPLRLLRSLRLQRCKAWKITTEDFIVIQAFEFSFILMFWKKSFGGENYEISLEISYWILALFLSEAAEASHCHSFENWLMKHKFPTLLNPLWTIIQ